MNYNTSLGNYNESYTGDSSLNNTKYDIWK